MDDFVISARNTRGSEFGTNPARSKYLVVPDTDSVPLPGHAVGDDKPIRSKAEWFAAVRAAGTWGKDLRTGHDRGDVLVFVHGYNNSPAGMLARHRGLFSGLKALGWKGTMVSSDWPSED